MNHPPALHPGTVRRFCSHCLAGLLLLSASLMAPAAETEDQCLQILQSSASPAEKDAACARLKRIATSKSIPALSALLLNDDLSHSARYVLESMPDPAAGQALLRALPQTSAITKAGIIQSLGARRETIAVQPLSELLTHPEATVATAAATALGQIGSQPAAQALKSALQSNPSTLRPALTAALLACAQTLAAADQKSTAAKLFASLYTPEQESFLRLAAYRGLIACDSDQGAVKRIGSALTGSDPAAEAAALQMIPGCQARNATKRFTDLLPQIKNPDTRRALIEALAQRADPRAATAIAAQLDHPSPEVRASALRALASLGDGTTTVLLAQVAARRSGDEQALARRALATINRGHPDRALLDYLPKATAPVQAEIAKALASRSHNAAVPHLLVIAWQTPEPTRAAALQALAALASPSQLKSVIDLVLQAPDESARAQAAEALNTAFQRNLARHHTVPTQPLIQAIRTAPVDAQVALLPVCSGLPFDDVRSALRTAATDSNPRLRNAGVRALCDSRDPALLPDLVRIASNAPEKTFRILALNACVQLNSLPESKLPAADRLNAFQTILPHAQSPEEKRLVLAGLSELPTPESLALVRPLLSDPSVYPEAARALIKIAGPLSTSHAATAVAALEQVAAPVSGEPAQDNLRAEARALLNELQSRADYLLSWQVAGPYRAPGQNYAALFDSVFDPEKETTKTVRWQLAAAGTDPKRPVVIDLLRIFGGEQAVGYARTWVRSPRDQACTLELASDDGVKVWLNGAVVHANNCARPLQPASDKVNLQLKEGWNSLLLKITQNNLGWEFCARLVNSDGSRLGNLDCRNAPPP